MNGRGGPNLGLEAIRIAEDAARAAERSAASALSTIERVENSLRSSEQRMTEVSAAAVAAAGEATEARLRATEIATEFRALEEQVGDALRIASLTRAAEVAPAPLSPSPFDAPPRPAAPSPAAQSSSAGATTTEFEALWESFDAKADRIVARLKALEARTMTVVRAPARSPRGLGRPAPSRIR